MKGETFSINTYNANLLASRLLRLLELAIKGLIAAETGQLDLAVGVIREIAKAEGQQERHGKQKGSTFLVELEILTSILAHTSELLDSGILAKSSSHDED